MTSPASSSPSPAPPTPSARALAPTVVALGVVSLLTDAASDMIWPLLPVFLVEQLHRSVAFVGLIEGVAEATAAIGKYVVGRVSDRLARRKPVVLLGYSVSSLSRPLLALAATPWVALAVRFFDRVGKGIRTAPRDALIAQSTDATHRAAAFGFHRAMDNVGAVFGPLLAAAVLFFRPRDLRLVFALSAVPGALAVLAIVLLVREPARATLPSALKTDGAAPTRGDPGAAFRRYLVVVALFALGNASDFFLITKARAVGVPLRAVPLVWGALSLLRALAATPGGRVADRIGRRRALALGWGIYALAYAGLAFARSPAAVLACVLVYGLYYGLTEGAERALVASFARPEGLGRAYGAFALVNGLASIPASVAFGALYRFGDGRASFLLAGGLALLAALAMGALARREGAADR